MMLLVPCLPSLHHIHVKDVPDVTSVAGVVTRADGISLQRPGPGCKKRNVSCLPFLLPTSLDE